MHNQAFIDGQNLYLNIRANGWSVDLNRFRIYLAEKYNVDKAYYFIGVEELSNMRLYETIRSAGFILVFRRHSKVMTSEKKGNVDTDIVFAMMKKIAEREKLN